MLSLPHKNYGQRLTLVSDLVWRGREDPAVGVAQWEAVVRRRCFRLCTVPHHFAKTLGAHKSLRLSSNRGRPMRTPGLRSSPEKKSRRVLSLYLHRA